MNKCIKKTEIPEWITKSKTTLIQYIYSQGVGKGVGIEKCVMLVTKSGKQHITEGIQLRNQVVIGTLRENVT